MLPIFDKGNEQTIQSYCPVSFQPAFGNLFERLLYDAIYFQRII